MTYSSIESCTFSQEAFCQTITLRREALSERVHVGGRTPYLQNFDRA